MKWLVFLMLTVFASSTGGEPNFIVECYNHCDYVRADCIGQPTIPDGEWRRRPDYAYCQSKYRACLEACNNHRILYDGPPTMGTN